MNTQHARRVGMVLALSVVAVVTAGCPLMPAEIPDKALETAIRLEIHKPFGFITQGDLARLQHLDARRMNIVTLTGLEQCVSLTWLNLEGNKISNITPLTPLADLTYLNLKDNEISDIYPLAGLFFLKDLLLACNEVWDLAALVANAENGGMFGCMLMVSERGLLAEDGSVPADVADAIARLNANGVIVAFATQESCSQ